MRRLDAEGLTLHTRNGTDNTMVNVLRLWARCSPMQVGTSGHTQSASYK